MASRARRILRLAAEKLQSESSSSNANDNRKIDHLINDITENVDEHHIKSRYSSKMDERKNILHGGPHHVPVPDGTVGQYIHHFLKKNKNLEKCMTLAETGQSISYNDLHKNTCRLAQSLINHGFPINTIVSVCSENSIYYMYPIIGAFYAGLIVAPLNPNYTERELLHMFNIIKPKLIFCSMKVLSKIQDIKNKVSYIEKIIVLDGEDDTEYAESFNNFISHSSDVDLDPDNFKMVNYDRHEHIALILQSSGTTGLPKGVMLTDTNILIRSIHSRHPLYGTGLHIKPGGSVVNFLPLFHTFGFFTILNYFTFGLHVVQIQVFKEELLLRSIEKYKAQSTLVVPAIMIFLMKSPLVDKHDLTSLMEIVCGAACLPKEVFTSVKKRLNLKYIRQVYGLTEATGAWCVSPLHSTKYEAVGKLLPGTLAKIVDVDTNTALSQNKLGELCFKGDIIMKGYFENEEATKNIVDEDGWLHTGDIVYYDVDEHLYIVGRLKELIKYKGFQVAPAELEALLIEHPNIKEVAVVGKPDLEAGELPTAFVVETLGKTITEQEVHKFLTDKISPEKKLRGGIRKIDAIPRNTTGKIMRNVLRELLKTE
ncbi:hypothetical protein FQA39_LY13845 [Lamprigera yunnana]|nr:hypothetical protein FQA39_LY13845 [Lamprigera yunnana]